MNCRKKRKKRDIITRKKGRKEGGGEGKSKEGKYNGSMEE